MAGVFAFHVEDTLREAQAIPREILASSEMGNAPKIAHLIWGSDKPLDASVYVGYSSPFSTKGPKPFCDVAKTSRKDIVSLCFIGFIPQSLAKLV